jgi:hypothetical protein
MNYAHDLPPPTDNVPTDSVARLYEYILREAREHNVPVESVLDKVFADMLPEDTAQLAKAVDDAISTIIALYESGPSETIMPINPENFTADDEGVIWGNIGSRDFWKAQLVNMLHDFGQNDLEHLFDEAGVDVDLDELDELQWSGGRRRLPYVHTGWPEMNDETYMTAQYDLFGKITEAVLSGAKSRIDAFREALATYDNSDLVTAGRVIQDTFSWNLPEDTLAFYPMDTARAVMTPTGNIRVPLASIASLADRMEEFPDFVNTPSYQHWWETQSATHLNPGQIQEALEALSEFVDSDLSSDHPHSV